MRASLLHFALLLAFVACGKSTQNSTVSTMGNPQCDDSARLNGDGTATVLACAFEQQISNIQRNGYALTGTLVDAQGNEVAQMTMGCSGYMMGSDSSGTAVIINTDPSDVKYGEVRSHGEFHAGYASSTLPTQLNVPLRLETH